MSSGRARSPRRRLAGDGRLAGPPRRAARARPWRPRRGRRGRARRPPAPRRPRRRGLELGRRPRRGSGNGSFAAHGRGAGGAVGVARAAASGGSAGPRPWSPFRAGRRAARRPAGRARSRARRQRSDPVRRVAPARPRSGGTRRAARRRRRGARRRRRGVDERRRLRGGPPPGSPTLTLIGALRAPRGGRGRSARGLPVASGVVEHVAEDVLRGQEVTFTGRRLQARRACRRGRSH